MLLSPLAVLVAAPALAHAPCGFPDLAPSLAGRPRVRARDLPPPPALDVRDAWGTYPNELRSAHFVAKWGDRGGVSRGDVEELLAAFEDGWTVEIDEMGHRAPDGTDTYLFNVYVGDTGDGAPSGLGAGGYYYRDDDGYPYIVIARDSLYSPEYVASAAVHELYHAVQDAAVAYTYEGRSAWYWEATAEWAAGEVYPDNLSYAQFLFGYALTSERSIEFFDYPDTGALQEYHQYGAFVFARFLSEIVADRDLVVATWRAPSGATPLESIARELTDRGLALSDVFGEFATANARWDYADGDTYAYLVEAYEDWYGDPYAVAEVGGFGTDGEARPSSSDLPEQWAYNLVEIRTAAAGATLRVAVDGAGTDGSPAEWRVAWVDADSGAVTPLDVTGGEVTLALDGPDAGLLVAAAVPPAAEADERFGWAWTVTPTSDGDTGGDGVVDLDDGKETPGGCGCASGVGPASPILAAAAVLALIRRSRSIVPV